MHVATPDGHGDNIEYNLQRPETKTCDKLKGVS